MKNKILLLAGKGESSYFVMNWLEEQNMEWSAVVEDSISKKKFFQYRIKKLGLLAVIGQLIFIVFIKPLLCLKSKTRKKEILNLARLNSNFNKDKIVLDTHSINSEEVKNCILNFQPTIILVNGTRIISKKILNATDAPFVNMHAGITPTYRGVHGAYWAYYNKDAKNAGVTLHYVDKGVDTGKIIAQQSITITKQDNFCTYPNLQLAAGLELLKKFLNSSYEEMAPYRKSIPTKSAQWYHPTALQYLKARFRGVK